MCTEQTLLIFWKYAFQNHYFFLAFKSLTFAAATFPFLCNKVKKKRSSYSHLGVVQTSQLDLSVFTSWSNAHTQVILFSWRTQTVSENISIRQAHSETMTMWDESTVNVTHKTSPLIKWVAATSLPSFVFSLPSLYIRFSEIFTEFPCFQTQWAPTSLKPPHNYSPKFKAYKSYFLLLRHP